MATGTLPPLYPIVNVRDDSDVARARALAVALAAAGAPLVQLRAKTLGAGAFAALALDLVAAFSPSGTRLVVNDRADVALAAGAAGVHVGDEDLEAEMVRRLLGPDAWIGFSTHSLEEVAAAQAMPVDYLGFGPVFESPTKAGVREARGLEALAKACRASAFPVVAIGGVTLANASLCWKAGAASVAVIRDLETSDDVAASVAAYREAAAAQ